ncbi:MAG: biopolymer transporter ExbD [Spirochaetia bacterium]|nr:biopolymer transporter ExbD [Spirochaetia bacterium]
MMNLYFNKENKFKSFLKTDELETSSIGDMAFLLLIFFIVTSSFLMRMGIFLSLPSKEGGASKVEESQLFEITPMADGYKIGNESVDEQKAVEMLNAKKEKTEDVIFVVYMNETVRYERLIDALSIASRAKIKKISVKDAE